MYQLPQIVVYSMMVTEIRLVVNFNVVESNCLY